jgi:hypothetical protein
MKPVLGALGCNSAVAALQKHITWGKVTIRPVVRGLIYSP